MSSFYAQGDAAPLSGLYGQPRDRAYQPPQGNYRQPGNPSQSQYPQGGIRQPAGGGYGGSGMNNGGGYESSRGYENRNSGGYDSRNSGGAGAWTAPDRSAPPSGGYGGRQPAPQSGGYGNAAQQSSRHYGDIAKNLIMTGLTKARDG